MAKKTPANLRAQAKLKRHRAAEELLAAYNLDLEADRIEEQDAAKQEADRLLAASFFEWARQVRRCH